MENQIRNFVRSHFCRKAQELKTRIHLGFRLQTGEIHVFNAAEYEKKYVRPITDTIPWIFIRKLQSVHRRVAKYLDKYPNRVIFLNPVDGICVDRTPNGFEIGIKFTFQEEEED
jgi:hypothetical protein